MYHKYSYSIVSIHYVKNFLNKIDTIQMKINTKYIRLYI